MARRTGATLANDDVAQKTNDTSKVTAKTKKSRTVNGVGGDEGQRLTLVPDNKKSTAGSNSKPKRRHEAETTSENEDRQAKATPAKKPRTAAKPPKPTASTPTRRSGRVQTKAPTAPAQQGRKRRTKEEIAADKANAEAKRKEDEELTRERHRIMAQAPNGC